MSHFTFTSESVTEGHPDKMSDQISDGVLDAIFEQDPQSRVACETLCTTGLIVVAGEISTQANIDYQRTVRDTVRGIGYSSSAFGFDANTCAVITSIDEQSPDIAMGVDKAKEIRDGLTEHYDEVGDRARRRAIAVRRGGRRRGGSHPPGAGPALGGGRGPRAGPEGPGRRRR